MSDFATPAPPGGDKLPLADLNGALLLIEPAEALTGVATSFGVADPVRCTVHVLDGSSKSERFADALIFPKVLAGQLRSRIGEKVLGRLGQGVAKAGQSAPWVLTESTEADVEVARKYLAWRAEQDVVETSPF